jgi:hypothetical protein
MFHPLAPDVSGLSDDELFNKINEINNKIVVAWRTGSGSVVPQMQMILASYQDEAQRRNSKKLEEMEKSSKSFKNIIDIK